MPRITVNHKPKRLIRSTVLRSILDLQLHVTFQLTHTVRVMLNDVLPLVAIEVLFRKRLEQCGFENKHCSANTHEVV